MDEKKEAEKDAAQDTFLEKVILFLTIIVGGILIFNQFQFVKMSANILLNSVSLLLILTLAALVAWLFLKKEHHAGHSAKAENMSGKIHSSPMGIYEKLSMGLTAFVSIMIIFNQVQISQANSLLSGASSPINKFMSSVSFPLKLGLGSASGKGGVVIGPQLNSDGRTTKLVEWTTISDTPSPKDTGNPTQDAISSVVPTGTPFYASEGAGAEKIKGVSFDDPLTSQKVWASLLGSKRFGTANEIKLTAEEEQRWKKLTGVFTCDFCCGGPNSVTTIARCGCAHSYAWQGMAKFFIKYYPSYTDEQILGEMTKWKALWYPQGMIQDYMVYTGQQPASILTHGGSIGIKQQFLNQAPNGQHQTKATATPLSDLPSMVGGC